MQKSIMTELGDKHINIKRRIAISFALVAILSFMF